MSRKYMYLLLTLILVISSSQAGSLSLMADETAAAADAVVESAGTVDDNIYLFVKTPDGKIDNITYQVGTSLCSNIKPESVSQLDVAMKTLVLVDNSFSISKENRHKIKELLLEFISEKKDNELVRMATFDKQIHYLTDYESDYTALKKTIQGIEYHDQETYLTDVLYTVLDKDFDAAGKEYNRIIVISDGVNNKAIGYTKEELYKKAEEKSIPIYTFGCNNGKNNEQLKNMFALSRTTRASYYILDEVKDVSAPVNELAKDRQIVRLQVTPEDDVADGSIKSSKLSFKSAGKEFSLTQDVQMPFRVKKEKETTVQNEPSLKDQGEEKSPAGTTSYILIICLIAGGIAVIVIITVILLILRKRKHQQYSFEPMSSDSQAEYEDEIEEPTEIAGDDKEEMTCRIWAEPVKKTLVLTDMKSPSKTFQVPLVGSVIIGRSYKQSNLVIDYEKSISAKHCEIEMRPDNKLYIIDLDSSNGTYVNGNRVLTETEISSGVVIKLGRLEFKLEVR